MITRCFAVMYISEKFSPMKYLSLLVATSHNDCHVKKPMVMQHTKYEGCAPAKYVSSKAF